jgi:hypothetical protein
MDPLSVISGISGICSITVQLIYKLSNFVDEVKTAPAEVQALSNELAAFYSWLGQMKLLLESPRVHELPNDWTDKFSTLMKNCSETLAQLEDIVKRASKIITERRTTQVWKSVKYTFKDKQVAELRKRIASYNAILTGMLLVLSE